MKNYVLALWQLLTYVVIGVPLRLLLRVSTTSSFRYESGKRYIVAANHPNRLDTFIVLYSLPLKDVIRLVPFRTITYEGYMKNPFLFPLLILFGAITTARTKKGSVLERSVRLLERGETIFIFPAGSREKSGKKYTAKKGVAFLGRDVRNAVILPVNVSYANSRVLVHVKKLLTVKKSAKNLQKEADRIYETILSE